MKKKTSCYEDGGEIEFETKIGANKSISDDVRERAMKAMASGMQKDEAPMVKKTVKSTVTKLPMPDYSNEDLDRMGMNNDIKPVKSNVYSPKSQPESDREENSAWMRAYRKSEAAKANKPKGMKSGGKVSSASRRADGCAIRGKTRA